MRARSYLSPSQVLKWEREPETYYIEYLADTKVGRSPQTLPMAVGSAFDAYVKASLKRRFNLTDESFPYTEESAIARNIENPMMRKEAMVAGKAMLQGYMDSGAYTALCEEIMAGGNPTSLRMEVDGTFKIWGIPFVYKPDYDCDSPITLPNGQRVAQIVDWKVNGYCSKSNVSPKPGFVIVRDGWKEGAKSRGNGTAHKNAQVIYLNGSDGRRIAVNADRSFYMPSGQMDDWSIQLTIYGLGSMVNRGLLSEEGNIPKDIAFIVGIEQLACKTVGDARLPRVATHRWMCNHDIIMTLRERVLRMWETIHSDHVFRWMTKDESKRRCEELEVIASTGDNYWLFQ